MGQLTNPSDPFSLYRLFSGVYLYFGSNLKFTLSSMKYSAKAIHSQ